ncbi:MAG TPA: radical SAM protein, partial [Deltaproteobacteria bacterium]|nr:radical SAM protein [Deltaproteobacteria bacterium]
MTYQVTLKCNARCIMCDSWKTKSEDTLSLEDLSKI